MKAASRLGSSIRLTPVGQRIIIIGQYSDNGQVPPHYFLVWEISAETDQGVRGVRMERYTQG